MNHQNNHRKKRKLTPEAQFRTTLDHCSRTKNLSDSIPYTNPPNPSICHSTTSTYSSTFAPTPYRIQKHENRPLNSGSKFKLFNYHSKNENFKPNEAALTAVARLAAAKGDGEKAFELAKSVEGYASTPKLRTYGSALICFCDSGMADKAYEVEEHVKFVGIQLEEPELAALLKVELVLLAARRWRCFRMI